MSFGNQSVFVSEPNSINWMTRPRLTMLQLHHSNAEILGQVYMSQLSRTKKGFTRETKLPRNCCYIILSSNVGTQQRGRTMYVRSLKRASLFAHPDLKGELRHTARTLYIQQGITYVTLLAHEPKRIHKTHVAGRVIFGFITGVSSVHTPAGISYIWNAAS